MRRVDQHFLDGLAAQAGVSPRRRQHFNLHASYGDPCQRLVNCLCRDTYIQPHRHAADPKEETLIALQGAMGFIRFDTTGVISDLVVLAAGGDCPAVIAVPGEWHTVVALTDVATLLEVKAGPFDPAFAKEAAPWAADEGTDSAASYLRSLQKLFD